MKRSSQSRRGVHDGGPPASLQPEKAGWIRRFCGRGIFRELWRSRFVMLRGDRLYISEKEVKDERKAQEVFDLADYERSEELRKAKSRSKKNHSRFTVIRCRRPGNTVPNLVFLAVSPEEKESWVNALNVAIIKAKNRVLDEVTIEEDSVLVHPTRDRAKIPHSRRLPTRGHLLAVASTSSRGTLMLDLVAEEDYPQDPWENDFQVDLQHSADSPRGVGGRQRAGTDVSKLRAMLKEPKVKTGSLPRGSERSWGRQSHLEVSKVCKAPQVQVQSRTPQPGKRFSMQGRSRCASMDEVLSSRPAMIRSELQSELRRCPTEEATVAVAGASPVQPVGQLQSLIAQRMQRAQELLEEMRLQELQKAKEQRERGGGSPHLKAVDSPRLHHLRGSDSPHSRSSGSARSRSSDSPRVRSKDSPRLRGRESPRSRAKKSRSKASDSPRSRGSASPRLKAPSHPADSLAARGTSSELDESSPGEGGAGSPQVDGSPMGSESASPCLMSTEEVQCQDLSSPSGSFESSLPKSPTKPQLSPPPPPASPPSEEDEEVERRRAEAERLLEEAVSSWREAQEVLQEVKELQSQTLRRRSRRTNEKMTSAAATPGLPSATAAAQEDDTPASPASHTSPMDEDESEMP